MVAPLVAAVLSIISGIIGFVTSLPDWAKWVIFLLCLAFDSYFVSMALPEGLIGTTITLVGHLIFRLPDSFQVYSWQVMILAAFFPIISFLLNHSD